MRLGDRAAGIVAIAFGAAVAGATTSFPAALGQPVGPAAFPAAIGVALMVCGLLLVKTGTLTISGQDQGEMVSVPVFARFAAVLASVVFYAIALDRLGFLITASLLLAVLFNAFGVRRSRIPLLAAAVALAIHFIFYALLRVPLPWGVLEDIAW